MSVHTLTEQLADVLQQHGWMLATAESCTGGMIAANCTDLSGSSNWFERGFVTYSNEAKHDMLGVDSAYHRLPIERLRLPRHTGD